VTAEKSPKPVVVRTVKLKYRRSPSLPSVCWAKYGVESTWVTKPIIQANRRPTER
jgi:hypothetical protein